MPPPLAGATLVSSETATVPDAPAAPPSGLQFAASLASIFGPLNSTMIAVALPAIRSDFHIGVGALTWLISSYLIAVAVAQPASGRLGDAFGHLRIVQLGLVVLLVFSVAAVFAWNFPSLVVMRSLQGLAAALTMPNVLAYLRKNVEPERLGSVLGINGAAVSAGAALGPVLGGVLLLFGGWQLLFLANVAPALLTLWMLMRLKPDAGQGRKALVIDVPSLAALATALTGISLIGSAFKLHSPLLTTVGWVMFPLGIAVYLVSYRIRKSGVVDLHLFTRRNYAVTSAGVALSNLLMYTTLVAMPVYLSENRHLSDAVVGLCVFAISAALVGVSPIAGRASDRVGRRPPVFVGAIASLAGVAGLTLGVDAGPIAVIVVLLLVIGFGTGLASVPQQSAALQAWPTRMAGSASGTYSMMRYVGSISGTAMIAAVLGSHPATRDFQLVFGILIAFGVLNALVSLLLIPPATLEAVSVAA